jgi:hypothetical protein
MNKKLIVSSILVFTVAVISLFVFNKEEKGIVEARALHRQFLENSPFKETIKLSRAERKALSLPPNAYNERMWELTMNPATGIPTPYKVKSIATDILKSAPGSSSRAWEKEDLLM